MKANVRDFNIIKRACEEFDYEFNCSDPFELIVEHASLKIYNEVDYDYISIAETNNKYTTLLWCDDEGFEISSSGNFLSGDFRNNHYFIKKGREFEEVEWYAIDDAECYVLMDYVIDSDANKVALVCKYK